MPGEHENQSSLTRAALSQRDRTQGESPLSLRFLRFGVALGLASSLAFTAAGAPGADSVRRSPTVELIQRVKSAVVPVFAFGTNDNLNSGAGAVIHPSGYILTADHVARDLEGVYRD